MAVLTDTADAIAAGKVAAREVVEACLERIARLNYSVDADDEGTPCHGRRWRQAAKGRRCTRPAVSVKVAAAAG